MSASSSAPLTPDLLNSSSNPPGEPEQPQSPGLLEPPGLEQQQTLDEPASFSTCPLPAMFTIVLNYRKGIPRTSCRQLKNLPPTAPWAFDRQRDTYRGLLARIKGYAQGLQEFTFPVNGRLYLQPSNNAYQKNYVELSEENYQREMEATWRREARRLNSIAGVGVALRLYIYLQGVNDAAVAKHNTIRRASAVPTQAVGPRVDEAIGQNVIPAIGPVTRHQRGLQAASLVPMRPAAEPAIPDTNTYQQTRYVDQERQRNDERQQARPKERHATILIEINGVEVPIKVNLQSLRRALDLPRLDLHGMHHFQTRPLRRPPGHVDR